ncbi:MAG: cafA, partial [Alphaproteobacteria bacterium]|nr:cafA [Alphaproteobacteria bacterium]
LEAAEVVAQQLRLRNIGGAVLIDFITLRQAADRDRVLGRLALHLAADPLPTQVLGWTRLGLVEVARARRGRPLAELLRERAST